MQSIQNPTIALVSGLLLLMLQHHGLKYLDLAGVKCSWSTQGEKGKNTSDLELPGTSAKWAKKGTPTG